LVPNLRSLEARRDVDRADREHGMRVTIKQRRYERGRLALHRGFDINVDGKRVGSVAVIRKGWGPGAPEDGWYYSVFENEELGIPFRNTSGERGIPLDLIKAAAYDP
jgi:hypothetical protein